ncbi:MAG: hypothetical protein COC01_02395 [Bacteroidetes bacterium]|nr:MAG: hypothetical protein COC01_02395 [Bacteroidota bacterium]
MYFTSMRFIFKILCLFLFIIQFGFSGYAQKGFRIGLHTSFNSTWLTSGNVKNDDNVNYNLSFGKSYGGGVGYYINERVGLSLESYYEEYKNKVSGTINNSNFESTTNLIYLSPALLLRVYTLLGIYLELGPQMNLLVSQSYDVPTNGDTAVFVYTGIPQSTSELNDNVNNFTGANFSMIYGAGFSINMIRRLVLCAGIRYNKGLSNILSDIGNSGSTEENTTQSNALGILLGMQFKIH